MALEPKEKTIPYPTIAELSLGARPAIEATAPALIIGAIPASIMETFEAMLSQPKIPHANIATIGARISLMLMETAKGLISSFGRKSLS